MNRFHEIERLFAQLQPFLANAFSNDEIREVWDFVDAGEYGLALETMVDIFSEEGKKADASIVAIVRSLAVALNQEPLGYIQRLG